MRPRRARLRRSCYTTHSVETSTTPCRATEWAAQLSEWRDFDRRLDGTRLLPDGTVAPGWPVSLYGVAQQLPTAVHRVPGGEGGARTTWLDEQTPGFGGPIRFTRVSSAGHLDEPGKPIGNAAGTAPTAVPDGSGGSLVAWLQLDESNHPQAARPVEVAVAARAIAMR